MDVDSYIDVIARALTDRDGRGGGRATAFIGAGFSRNALKLTDAAREFPLWRDIVRPLIGELVPPCPNCPVVHGCLDWNEGLGAETCLRRAALHTDAAGASGMMALGDKFEAKMGSARLRAALESAIPDRDYAPGPAHQLLVRLPWADILTTNWDSLLERAVDEYDRSYSVVVTVKQIASTSSPRIVKLHGCLRSGTELVFSEESFRQYPQTYGPFVSMVQQSLMENVVVLFGFSGSDPNFRAWHGWVRDNLKKDSPPIFIVSLKRTEPIDVSLMAGRLITHIDLSERWQHLEPNIRIERFLIGIKDRMRKYKIDLDWPFGSSSNFPANEATFGSGWKVQHDDRIDGTQYWSERLAVYPKWLVAPI
jgi:hypothetical protein